MTWDGHWPGNWTGQWAGWGQEGYGYDQQWGEHDYDDEDTGSWWSTQRWENGEQSTGEPNAFKGPRQIKCEHLTATCNTGIRELSILDEVKPNFESGKRLLERGQFQGAARSYERALELLYPHLAGIKQGGWGGAAAGQFYNIALTTFLNLAQCYLKGDPPQMESQPSKALEYCDAALAIDSKSAKAIFCKATALQNLGMEVQAQAERDRAQALFLQEYRMSTQGKNQQELHHCLQPIVDPHVEAAQKVQEEAQRLREQGAARFKSNDVTAALDCFEQGWILLDEHGGLWKDAAEETPEVKKLHGLAVTMLTNIALCCFHCDSPDLDKVVAACEQALRLDPNNVKALYRKGKALADLGWLGEAEQDLEQAAMLAPKDTGIRSVLDDVREKIQQQLFHAQLDDTPHSAFATHDDEAEAQEVENTREHLRQKRCDPPTKEQSEAPSAREAPPTLEALLEEAVQLRAEGGTYFKNGEIRCAARIYEEGMEVLRPHQPRWHGVLEASGTAQQICSLAVALLCNLALCHIQGEPPEEMPDFAKAVACCQEALDLDPKCAKAAYRKGKALSNLRRHVEAQAEFARAARLEPKDAGIRKELVKASGLAEQELLLEQIRKLHDDGNMFLQKAEIDMALQCNEEGVKLMWGSPEWPSHEDMIKVSSSAAEAGKDSRESELLKIHISLLVNLAFCYVTGGSEPQNVPSPEKALAMCQLALAVEANNWKALYYKGKALAALHHYVDAEIVLEQAATIAPLDEEIRDFLGKVKKLSSDPKSTILFSANEHFDGKDDLPSLGTAHIEQLLWPEDVLPTPLGNLGPDGIAGFAEDLAQAFEEQGIVGYTMQLLYTIKAEVERFFGRGAGKQLSRLVPLVQGMAKGEVKATVLAGMGKRTIPSFIDGLKPEQPWHDASEHPWCEVLARSFNTVLRELRDHEARSRSSGNLLWMAPDGAAGLQRKWSINLVRQGVWVAGDLFKSLRRVLSSLTGCRPYEMILVRAPPGASAPVHRSDANCILSLHIGLDLDEGLNVLQVGDQTRLIGLGKALIFDHTFEHKATNNSERECYYLTCRFYHPGITEVERYALLYLAELVEAMDQNRIFGHLAFTED